MLSSTAFEALAGVVGRGLDAWFRRCHRFIRRRLRLRTGLQGGPEFRFDRTDALSQSLAPVRRCFRRQVRVGFQRSLKGGQGGQIDPFAMLRVGRVSLFQGCADCLFYRVQITVPRLILP